MWATVTRYSYSFRIQGECQWRPGRELELPSLHRSNENHLGCQWKLMGNVNFFPKLLVTRQKLPLLLLSASTEARQCRRYNKVQSFITYIKCHWKKLRIMQNTKISSGMKKDNEQMPNPRRQILKKNNKVGGYSLTISKLQNLSHSSTCATWLLQ